MKKESYTAERGYGQADNAGVVMGLGSFATIHVDLRVTAVTHKSLQDAVFEVAKEYKLY